MPASYKVPQDVEAEDKLLGPFSFRQFIFLMVAVMSAAAAWALWMLWIPLAIIPVPLFIVFGALALPLRKDQPMEVYLMAVLSFLLKPKKRLWRADGVETMVEVVAPKTVEEHLTKGYNQAEVQQRLSYLANLVDSHGWSVRGVPGAAEAASMYDETLTAADILDDNSEQAKNFDTLIDQTNAQRRQAAIEQMHKTQNQATQTAAPGVSVPSPYDSLPGHEAPASQSYTPQLEHQSSAPDTDDTTIPSLTINPYPTMRQSVIHPAGEAPVEPHTQAVPTQQPESTTSETPISPAIIDLANNHKDLSVETIQREADRIKKAEEEKQANEVVISLR